MEETARSPMSGMCLRYRRNFIPDCTSIVISKQGHCQNSIIPCYWDMSGNIYLSARVAVFYGGMDSRRIIIYAQRPDATACAEYDLWNEKMGRYVRRGSKGIALVDDSGDRPRLRYVFDISDTGTREHSRTPWLWKLEDRHMDRVTAMLERTYDVTGDNIAQQLTDVAGKLAEEYWTENRQDFFYIVDGSFLRNMMSLTSEYSSRQQPPSVSLMH